MVYRKDNVLLICTINIVMDRTYSHYQTSTNACLGIDTHHPTKYILAGRRDTHLHTAYNQHISTNMAHIFHPSPYANHHIDIDHL